MLHERRITLSSSSTCHHLLEPNSELIEGTKKKKTAVEMEDMENEHIWGQSEEFSFGVVEVSTNQSP